MKKVRFTFYKAKFEWRNVFKKGKKLHVVDDLISWWTWLFNWFTPGYSHVVEWIPDEDGEFHWYSSFIRENWPRTEPPVEYRVRQGICYTSTMRGDNNGTVSRPAAEVFTNPKRWHFLEFEVTDESFEQAKAWADERVRLNKGYSMKDIRRFFMPLWLLKKLKWDDPERDICSEFAEGMAILLWRRYLEPCVGIRRILMRILIRSPRRLWRDLVRRHGVATYSLATGAMVRDSKGKRVKA